MIKKTFLILIGTLRPILAMAGDTGASSGLKNPLGDTDDFQTLISAILHAVSTIGAVLVVLAIIYAGFLFVTAQGNADKIKQAKNVFLWTLVGAIVLLGAEALSQVIRDTATDLGVSF